MRLIQCILTENDCYKTNQWIKPKGVCLHSTGANNPTLKRYVQPLETDEDYDQLIELLGYNRNQNDWNRPGTNACVHGFIGKLADGSIATAQTLPWNMRGWHAGSGTTRPSANNTHISFEICEDDLTDPDYFQKVYKEAVELTAHLCTLYDLDPLEPEVVICHHEGAELGMASNHADVEHWFPKFGKSMDDFRQDVYNTMKEDEDMNIDNLTDEQLLTLHKRMKAVVAKQPGSDWSQEYRDYAVSKGWSEGDDDLDGDGEPDFKWQDAPTREELATVLTRYDRNG